MFTHALLLLRLAVPTATDPEVTVVYDSAGVVEVPAEVRAQIQATATEVARTVQALLPELTDRIKVTIQTIDRDLSSVGGAAGRADAPGEVVVMLSASYPGGLDAAVRDGLATVLYHEFHHLVRGWTIRENRFGPGIPIAAVNEGLAGVFADTYSGVSHARFDYPDNVEEWLDELLALPLDADYNEWMNDHPDGRIAAGYRTGRYVVHQAMRHSGMSILELTAVPPEEILRMARETGR